MKFVLENEFTKLIAAGFEFSMVHLHELRCSVDFNIAANPASVNNLGTFFLFTFFVG